MRRPKSVLGMFLLVGVIFLLVIGLMSLLLPLFGYGEDPEPEPITEAEPIVEEPSYTLPGVFSVAEGWKRYNHEGFEALRGVDVSSHQGAVDWQALRRDGAQFAMLRAGYRGYTDGGLFEDPLFRSNAEAAASEGIALGVYFFSQAITVEEAEAEARFVLELLEGLDITWPIAFDWEPVEAEARTDNLSGRDMTACALAFCQVIREAGYTPAIYTNQAQSRLYYGYAAEELADIHIWLADYQDTPEFDHTFHMWQYTDAGTLAGVDVPIDLNLSFVDYASERTTR